MIGHCVQQGPEPGRIGLGEIAQHIAMHQRLVAGVADAHPHADEMRSAMGDHGADAVVASRPATKLHPDFAGLEVELVIKHDDP